MRLFAVAVLAAGAFAQQQPPRFGCEPAPEVAAGIRTIDELRNSTPLDVLIPRAAEALRPGLAAHPADIFGNLRYLSLMRGKGHADVIAAYRARMELNAVDPRYALFYATSLIGTNTPEALKRLTALASERFPYPYLVIGEVHTYPAFKDEAAVSSSLARFIRACPSYLPAYSWLRWAGATGDDLDQAAAALRRALTGRTDQDAIEAYRTLWAIEFRAAPASQHPALRAQVEKDIASFASVDLRTNAATLREGYTLTGNTAAINALPRTPEARRQEAVYEASEEWTRQNPWPKPDAPADEIRKFDLRRARAASEWIARWPDEPMPHSMRFQALARLKDTSNEDLIAAGQALIDVNRKRPGRYLRTPAIVAVARAYVERGIELDKIPMMIERGLHEAETGPRLPESDLFTDDRNRRMDAEGLLTARVEAREVEFQWGLKSGKHDVARSALAAMRVELDAFPADPMQPGMARFREQRYWRAMAELSDAEGNKEAAAAHRSAAEQAGRAPVRIAAASSGWTRAAKQLPDLRAMDLGGKTWTSGELAGKVVVMNVWATWCEPCVRELPLVQKLYESGSVVVLTLNIDANPGVVAPFVKARGFTFPVLLATDFVNPLLPDGGIPRTWIVRDRVMLREQIGFSSGGDWGAGVIAQVEQVGRE